MTTDLETSVYIQPNLDYDSQDKPINIKMDYIEALNTGGLNGVTEKVVSLVVDGTLGSAGSFVLDLANGAFKLNVAVDQNNPLGASVSLVNTGTGLVIGGAVSLIFEIAGVAKVLSSVSKANLLSWVTGTLITSVATDGVEYEMVAALYKKEYKEEYDAAKRTKDIIVNAGSSSLEDIKEFLYYSNVLKESDDVYVSTTDGAYKVVRGSEYDAIVDELSRRGYYGGNDITEIYNDIFNLNELEPNSGTFRQNVNELTNENIQSVHIYKDEKFILIKNDDITFPFQGNNYDNTIYLDNNGEKSYGSVGNDTITGGTGNDTIYGDSSAYAFGDVGNGNDSLLGGAGNDTIYGEGGDDIIYGNTGNDSIFGGSGKDYLAGGEDNDIIDGGDNNDEIYGGIGNDSLLGGSGNDYLSGYDGDDTIYGGTGNDVIYGGDNDDKLYGESGNDTIYGGNGNNVISGGSGDNFLFGGSGNDVIIGGDGVDVIDAGLGNNIIQGGMGKDIYIIGNGNNTITDFDGGYLGYYNSAGQIQIITGPTDKVSDGVYVDKQGVTYYGSGKAGSSLTIVVPGSGSSSGSGSGGSGGRIDKYNLKLCA